MAVIKIEVISDPVCVWCFVGKRTLDRAISLYQKTYPNGKNDNFKIEWQPYYLGKFSPGQSVDKSEIEKIRFKDMTPEAVDRLRNRMIQIGKSVGINYKYGGKIGHTRDAHRLLHFVQTKHPKAQDAVVEGIFAAHQELEQDITDIAVLRSISENAALDGDEVVAYLKSDQDKSLVDKQAKLNREQVTTGVPTFLINNEYRVDGAQDLQEFIEAFIKVKEGSDLKA